MLRWILPIIVLFSFGGVADATYLPPGASSAAPSVAAGTGCPSGGTTLTSIYNVITSAASGSCVTMPSNLNTPITVIDRSQSSINVFPPSGARFEALGTNQPLTVPDNTQAQFTCTTTTQCFQNNLGAQNNITTPASTGTRIVIGNWTTVMNDYQTTNQPTAPTVANLMLDIQDAQAMGIDAFEIDVQAWTNVSYLDYPTTIANLFTAAHNLGTGFKLFFFIDCQAYGNPICSGATTTLMSTYANDPNYLHYNGRPVMTSFETNYDSTASSSDEVFWHAIFLAAQTAAGVRPVYLASTLDEGQVGTDGVLSTQITRDTAWYINNVAADTDGLSMWDHDTPISNSTQQDALASVMASQGKLFMTSVTPFFSQMRLAFQASSGAVDNMEQHGLEGLIASWMDTINNLKPPFVRIQTWNDHTESYADLASTAALVAADTAAGGTTAVGPTVGTWEMPTNSVWTHAAFAVVNQYFTQWYKTGVQPNWPDSIYVTYRNGAQALVPSASPAGTSMNWEPNGIEPTLDDIYVTTILKSPATVTVTTGGTPTVINAAAGVNSYRVPFATGTQTVVLARNGSTLVSITGANVVTSETQYFNINPLTYFGHNP